MSRRAPMHVGLTGEMENLAERWREERGRRPGTWLRHDGTVAVGRGGQVMSAWGMVGLPRRRSALGCPDAATTRGDYGVGDEKKVKKRREDYGFKVCRWVIVAC